MAPLRHGVAAHLEAEADRLLRESLKGVHSYAAKSDILTPWKESMRQRREVYTSDGTPDSQVRRGLYHRAANPRAPHLNSRDGIARGSRFDSLREHIARDSGGLTATDDGWG